MIDLEQAKKQVEEIAAWFLDRVLDPYVRAEIGKLTNFTRDLFAEVERLQDIISNARSMVNILQREKAELAEQLIERERTLQTIARIKVGETPFDLNEAALGQVAELERQLTEWNEMKCDSCRYGWACECHPDCYWPHIDRTGNDCPGPGMPCTNKKCFYYAQEKVAELESQVCRLREALKIANDTIANARQSGSDESMFDHIASFDHGMVQQALVSTHGCGHEQQLFALQAALDEAEGKAMTRDFMLEHQECGTKVLSMCLVRGEYLTRDLRHSWSRAQWTEEARKVREGK